jgi:CBS domain-containing protein
MIYIRQILRTKSGQVWSVKPDQTVYEALELMAQKDIGAVIVVDGHNKMVGIFSERDYARKVILMGRSSRTTTVEELMTHDVVTVNPDTTLREAMELMTHRRIRHLPVMDNTKLVGIVTIGDVVNAVISDQAEMIAAMQNYITGTGQAK